MAYNVGAKPVGILARALTSNIFVEKSLAFMNEGDKDGYNAYKHDIKNVLRAYSDNPASTVANTSQKQAFKRTLVIVESFETFDPAEYHSHWREFQPTGPFQWEGLPSEVQSTLEELFLGSSAEAVEDLLTNGDGTLLSGLILQLSNPAFTVLNGAEATPTQVVNNTAIAFRAHGGGTGDNLAVDFTVDNIFPKLELLIKKQTKAMRKRVGRKFMMSHGTADIIREAQRLKLNFKGVDVTEEGVMRYAGYDLIENPSFPDNTLVFCSMTGDMKTDAIQLGTSQSSDFNNVEVKRVSNFGRKWGMLLTFALDIFVVRPEEVAFYTTETIA
ncbi:structural protein [Cellulophaga phage phi19:2]|uniref:Structural protein n=3 Tax=Cellulophaga phage phiST TaxID=756282 RepID=M4SLB4_9CAUD|nr:virion structural protein [Cellulophaga phage phiST]AGH56778.1 hypothetical protein CGPG_00080 [Cellulophaga phage phiST]AGO47166.1 structural protein [Cellulophaga phage phiST]AGO48662.1 structural protein [Cellulophaga phage phi19:2]AGO49032.1 structural protein [Cellulophaga phage phi13:1]